MLEYTWKPRNVLIDSTSEIVLEDMLGNPVQMGSAPVFNNGQITVSVPSEGSYKVRVKTKNTNYAYRINVNDTANDAPSSFVPSSARGSVNGVAPLGADGKVPDANLPSRLAAASLNASYVPKWKASTAYLTGDPVVSPSGDVVMAKTGFTSGATYDSANWNLSSSFAGKTATGYSGSPAIIQDATLSPSDIDGRTLNTPTREKPVTSDTTLVFGERRNKWQYTEDVASNRYATTSATKTTDTVTIDGITLTRITSSNFYGQLRSPANGLGLTPFVTGNRYLLSCYVLSRRDVEHFVWMRDRGYNAGAGHGQRLLQPNRMTRIWNLVHAVSTSKVEDAGTPSVAWGSGAAEDPRWIMQGNASSMDVYIGGFQIEDMGTAAVDGIAVIGDSTIQGASGSNDSGVATETMGYLAGLLNATTFNRGIGGNKTNDMDSRWATDITPLKHRCKYVIIQGGINDIGTGRALADIKTSILSMHTKALADGLIPVFLTSTPASSLAADTAKEQARIDLNAWLKQTFPRVIDIAPVVEDPFDKKYLRRTPGGSGGWYGDGVHYTQKAKRAIAEKIAAWPGWDLPTPSPYQKITAATWTPYGGIVLVSPNGTKYQLTVADGGALTTTAI